MSDAADFKDPKLKIYTSEEDTSGFYNEIYKHCLACWDKGNEEVGIPNNLGQSQILTAMISLYVGFLQTAYDPEITISLLEELLRRARLEKNKGLN